MHTVSLTTWSCACCRRACCIHISGCLLRYTPSRLYPRGLYSASRAGKPDVTTAATPSGVCTVNPYSSSSSCPFRPRISRSCRFSERKIECHQFKCLARELGSFVLVKRKPLTFKHLITAGLSFKSMNHRGQIIRMR